MVLSNLSGGAANGRLSQGQDLEWEERDQVERPNTPGKDLFALSQGARELLELV